MEDQDSNPPKKMSDLAQNESRTIVVTCEESGRDFELSQIRFGDGWYPDIRIHPSILEQREKEEKLKRKRENEKKKKMFREAWINDQVPSYYHKEPDRERFKDSLNWEAFDKALEWDGKGSLMLKGKTRKGKTRAMYELIKRYAYYLPPIYTAERIARLLGKAMTISPHKHEETLQWLATHKFLAIDDLGKEVVTHRVQADMFEILNERFIHDRMTILTSNYHGDDLVKRYPDQQTAIPFVERIREFCKVVEF